MRSDFEQGYDCSTDRNRVVNPFAHSLRETESLRRKAVGRRQNSDLIRALTRSLRHPRATHGLKTPSKPNRKTQEPREAISRGSALNDRLRSFVEVSKAPRVGLEPTTSRLTAGCSTIELPRNHVGANCDGSGTLTVNAWVSRFVLCRDRLFRQGVTRPPGKVAKTVA